MVCPYGVIKRNVSGKKIVSKCDMCEDEDVPVCVKNCPNEALRFKEANGKSVSDESLAGADNNE